MPKKIIQMYATNCSKMLKLFLSNCLKVRKKLRHHEGTWKSNIKTNVKKIKGYLQILLGPVDL